MATQTQRSFDFDGSWIKGSNSSMDPSSTPLGYAWSFVNMLNIAGVPTCRPGHRCLVELPSGNLQGMVIFRPSQGLEQMLIAVSGVIYAAPYPFIDFNPLLNILFSPFAKKIYWMQATQTNRAITPGSLTSALEIIPAREVLVMQDGGFSAPAFFDGSQSGQLRSVLFETPAGSSMEWVGDRLWVANNNRVFASDIGNPFSFREEQYLGSNTAFYFSRDITAMSRTPSLEFPQLVVLTEEDASLLQADIRDRALWPNTIGFQKEILQVGCASDRAITSHFGRLVWYSPSGLVFFDPATARGWTSRSPIRDNEMMISKSRLAPDVSGAAIGVFGQWLLVSLPVDDLYNKHTWVLNNASFETVSDEGGPTWSGYWLGTRPVEWAYGVIVGQERIYHVSFDEDGVNRLWESFTPDRLDNGCPITWAMVTRGMFGITAHCQPPKPPGFPCRFTFADVALAAIEEDLDIGVFVAPGSRGSYRKIMSKKIAVSRGSLNYAVPLNINSVIFEFKAQSRTLRTEDNNLITPVDAVGGCGVESDKNEDVDESFQMMIVGQGPATIKWIRPWALFPSEEDFSGDPNACTPEDTYNGVRYDGIGVHAATLPELIADLTVQLVPLYTSNQTSTVSYQNFSAVGVGYAESLITQSAADRVASIIATQQAEAELAGMVPPIFSEGLTDEPIPPIPPVFSAPVVETLDATNVTL